MEDGYWPDDVPLETAASRRHEEGKAVRLRKWKQRLKNNPEGSMGYCIARDMIAELTRPEISEKSFGALFDVAVTEMGDKNVTAGYFEGASPDQLDEAALNLAVKAQAIREFDALEPQGDEPTISFTHKYHPTDEKEYTFVAFKANGENSSTRWHVTGARSNHHGYTWRELGAKFPNVAAGRFHVATGWEWQGD